MNKSVLAIAVIACSTGIAAAQTCENGVCRLNPPPTRDVPGQLHPQDYGARRAYDGQQHSRPFGSVGGNNSITRCANDSCRGINCDCGPNCDCGVNCDCSNHGQNESRYRGDSFQAPNPRRSNFNTTGRPPTNSSARSLNTPTQRQLPVRDTNSYRPVAYTATPVDWHHNLRKAADLAEQTGRPMLIKVSADWCGHCQQMKRETFSDSRVIRDINQHFVAVDLDADVSREVVAQLRITSLPTILVVAPDLRILAREEGFRTAVQIGQLMHRHMRRAELETEILVVSR